MGTANTATKSSQTTTKARTKTARKTARKSQSQSPIVSKEQRLQMIEESAYYRAEQRRFQGGDPVADWLLSEKEVDDLLSQSTH